ncbi:MAG: hypothetical protein WCB18_03580 [Thermoplasmata archaeon]
MAQAKPDLAILRVKIELRRRGLLPFTDPESPSLVSIVAGAPVSGSWWGHPAGHAIYGVGEALESGPDVLLVRLWRAKQTLVHRRLWPALVAVGSSRARWQLDGLSEDGQYLLAQVNEGGVVRNDLPRGYAAFRPALRELEKRLLVLTRSVHTPTGAHALEARSWSDWRKKVRAPTYRGSVASAQRKLEDAARPLTPGVDPRRLFPWGRS